MNIDQYKNKKTPFRIDSTACVRVSNRGGWVVTPKHANSRSTAMVQL